MTRREISFLVLGLTAGAVATVFAAESAEPRPLASGVFTWESLPVEKTANGERRAIFDSATATVDRLETHITTIDAGKASHAAHRHPDEELIFVREGVVEATINGVATQGAGRLGDLLRVERPARHAQCRRGTGQLLRAALDFARQGRPEARRIPMSREPLPNTPRRVLTGACCC